MVCLFKGCEHSQSRKLIFCEPLSGFKAKWQTLEQECARISFIDQGFPVRLKIFFYTYDESLGKSLGKLKLSIVNGAPYRLHS